MPSTVIADMGYDPQHRTLSIRFRPSGRRYHYFEVPSEAWEALRQARAKGRFFNLHIRNRYRCALVEADAVLPGSMPAGPLLRP
jgi:hypothetical protein